MYKYLVLLLIFFSIGLHSQNTGLAGLAFEDETAEYTEASSKQEYLTPTRAEQIAQFESKARAAKVKFRVADKSLNVTPGYYVITGVFGQEENAQRLLKSLKKTNENPGIFKATEKLHYVYTSRYNNSEEAIDKTLVLGDAWILNVPSPEKVKPTAPIPASTKSITPQKTDPVTSASSKLVQKADDYFHKMWYAEAAKLYEEALEKNKANHSFEIIRKTADSHYFNTDMERAYYWYDILYKEYGKEMSADNLFKYAHSLKGTGKYARAKRFMRLYKRKMKDPDSNISEEGTDTESVNEAVLDNIIKIEHPVDLKNLSTNSKYSEFSPMFYEDGNVVFSSAADSSFFSTRRYKWNNQPYLDLYVAKMNEESTDLREAVKFSKKINTKYHEASVAFSPDNQTLYFTRNNYQKKLKRDKKGVNHLKIFRSRKINGEWQEAEEMPFNSDSYSTGHPALSPDGKQLYFVSDMPGSIGETDIFVVDVFEDGTYSEPRNLGPEINTERKEMFPFISDKKLYFSSNGHIGLGGLDIYKVAFDEERGFLEVENLGKPINSNKDDFSYIVKEETQQGFFASNRNGGKGDDDIYSFKRLMPEEKNENAIEGVVTELITGDVMPKALVTLLDENNIKIKEVEADDDGRFVFEDLESNKKYVLKTYRDDYFEVTTPTETRDNEVVSVDVEMKKLKEMIVVEDGIRKLKTEMIYFNFDRFNIRSDASEELDKLVTVMKEYPEMVIKIESHTDSRGSKAYNKYLSDRRAKSTRDYIISQGIDPSRIESAIGYGEERLLNECDGSVACSSAKHQLNRRSEFIIVSM